MKSNFIGGIIYNPNRLMHFNVRSCHFEATPWVRCKIGLSNALLLAVSACILIKVFYCALVVLGSTHTSLVTPRDAIESFISGLVYCILVLVYGSELYVSSKHIYQIFGKEEEWLFTVHSSWPFDKSGDGRVMESDSDPSYFSTFLIANIP